MHDANTAPRIADLVKRLVGAIPCKPDSSEVRRILAQKDLRDLMLVYVNYASRFVTPRPRRVAALPGWDTTPAYRAHRDAIRMVIMEILAGADLTPRLSDRVHVSGYAHPERTAKGRLRRWEDKDFALNAYGVHHLHLGPTRPDSSPVDRTRDLLYVRFDRGIAILAGVADHNAFDDGTVRRWAAGLEVEMGRQLRGVSLDVDGSGTESTRHQLARMGVMTLEAHDGHVVAPVAMNMSGHRSEHVRHVDRIVAAVRHFEPIIDTPDFRRAFFADAKHPAPPDPMYRWEPLYTELRLIELRTSEVRVMVDGLS